MMKFNQYLEEKANIQIVGTDNYGNVSFNIGGKKYTYNVDAAWFNPDTKFSTFMKHAPGRALNLAKKYGRLV